MSQPRTFFASASAAALAIGLAACSHAEHDPRTNPPLVRVATAGANALPQRAFTGIVSARVQSNLGFRVPGKIEARLVDTGQVVHAGQPLMRLDPTDLALNTLALGGAVDAARARAAQTAADEKRYRGLVSAGAVSASAYDLTKAAADSAAAQLSAAEAQVHVAHNEAGYAVLLADADGTVIETLAEPGQVVSAGQPVVRLARSGPREATVSLPETLRPTLGSVAKATIYGGTAKAGTATLRQLSDSADPQTRTFDARYVLGGAAADAPLGSTVTVEIPDSRAEAALQIPLSAIYDAGKGPGVWIVTSGTPATVSWRPVTITGLGEETAGISSGVAAGDRFVSLGAHLLHDHEPVRVAAQGNVQ